MVDPSLVGVAICIKFNKKIIVGKWLFSDNFWYAANQAANQKLCEKLLTGMLM